MKTQDGGRIAGGVRVAPAWSMLTVMLCICAMRAPRAEAWNPLKAAADKAQAAARAIGGALGVPAGGFIESATTPVLHTVENTGHRLIADVDRAIASNLERTGGLITQTTVAVNATLAEVDRSLAARILQVQTAADHTLDHAFDRVDLLFGRLEADAQQLIERAGDKIIKQIDHVAAANLAQLDHVLVARVGDLQLLLSSSIQQADDIARERLAQLDELAGRRIGNIDVLATKQSLSLEGALVRIAALIGLVGLIGFVAWRLFREVADAFALAGHQSGRRLRAIGRRSVARLLPQLALAGGGVLLLSFLASYLPRDSERRSREQVARHTAAFDAAARALDVLEARYHASQLEILAPDAVAAQRGRLKKVELLHALFTRPGQLHTPQGLADLVAQVADVEAALGEPDADVMIAKAYILWQVGGTRDDEYEAAVLCGQALRRGDPALLAPLARNYIAAFLADPYTPPRGGALSLEELARLAAAPPGAGETHQLGPVIELDQLIGILDRASTAAYLDMIAAHAQLRIALSRSAGSDSAAARAARASRTAAANKLVDAWAAFDHTLTSSSTFAGDAMVLSVFTLDDAVLSRARYWAAVPSANGLAPVLSSPSASELSPALRARIAPLRVAWENRYAAMLGPHERDLVAYQEARRFAAFEQRASSFETAYVEWLVAAGTGAPPAKLRDLAVAAAIRASGLCLHRDTEAGRVREATRILATVTGVAPSDVLAAIERNYQMRRLRVL